MRLRVAALAALAAALALPCAAAADTFTVDADGDAPDDVAGDAACATAGGVCTLRAALEEADALAGADTIRFAADLDEIAAATTLRASSTVSLIGPARIRFAGDTGPLLQLAAGSEGSVVRDLALRGGATAGIDVGANGITIRSTRVSGSAGPGIDLNGTRSVVTRSPVYANAAAPIVASPVSRPSSLRVGPRGADNRLALTGTSPGGVLELFRGDPTASSPITFLRAPTVPAGSFRYVLPFTPVPGSILATTVTSGGGTSAFSQVRVPFDLESPDVAGAVAISLNEVTVQLTEPVRPASVGAGDFSLSMAGVPRTIAAVRMEPGGAQVTLTSTTAWGHGEAGALQLGPPGAIQDLGGNASLSPTGVGVAAAPGDLIPPIGSSLSISPSTICLTATSRCRRTGATVRFTASEGGRAHLVLMRGNRRIGTDVALAAVGRNRIRFAGRLGNRKLRAGSYRMLLYIEDEVGNITVEPPLQLFTVRRATPARPSRGSRRRR